MRSWFLVFSIISALLISKASFAELGGSISTFSQSTVSIKKQSNYIVTTSTLPNGVVVTEYTDLNGYVFASAWTGPKHPDMNTVLGRYLLQYQSQPLQGTGTHRGIQLQSSSLVVKEFGRMGLINGLAYLPLSLPSGFNPDILQN
jgi:Protein of unknown function (DUF2844)